MLAAAGAAIAAVPYMSRVSAFAPGQSVGADRSVVASRVGGDGSGQPLVVVVKGDEMLGFRGLNEFRLVDPALASTIAGAFRATEAVA